MYVYNKLPTYTTMQEIIYQDLFITIVKDTWNKGTIRLSEDTIVDQGMTRFWLYNSDLTDIYCHSIWDKEYGYNAISTPSEGIIRVEYTVGQWYYINIHGKLLTNIAFAEASDFKDGFASVRVGPYNGNCIIDHDGNTYIKDINNRLVSVPSGYSDGFIIDENHIAFYSCGEYKLFEKGCPLSALNGNIKFKTFEKGLADWYIILDSHTILNLDDNSTIYKDPQKTIYELIGDNCLHMSTCEAERDYNSLYFRNGNENNWFGEIKVIENEQLILINQVNYGLEDDFDSGNYISCYGCITYSGEILIPITYSRITFSNDSIDVELENQIYTYTKNGNLLYKDRELPKGIHAYEELDSVLKVRTFLEKGIMGNFHYGIINMDTFTPILPIEYSTINKTLDDKYIVCKNYRYGLLDSMWNLIIECKYRHLSTLNNGAYICQFENNDYAVITEYEDYLIPETFSRIIIVDDNRLSFSSNNSKGILTDFSLNTISYDDTREEVTLSGFWNLRGTFHNGYCAFVNENGGMGIVNYKSEVVTQREYHSIEAIETSGVYIGTSNNSKFFIRPDYKIEKEMNFQSYQKAKYDDFSNREADFISVSDGSAKGLINLEGDIIIDCIYSNIEILDDCILLHRNNRKGIADFDGNILIPCDYNCIETLDNKYHIVGNQHASLISPYGHIVVPETESYYKIETTDGKCLRTTKILNNGEYYYGLLSPIGKLRLQAELSYIGKFINGEALGNLEGKRKLSYNTYTHKKEYVFQGGYWGIINEYGSWVIPPKYYSIGKINNGHRQVAIKKGDRPYYGIVRHNGEVVINCDYSYARNVVDKMIVYAVGGNWTSEGFEKERLNLLINDPFKFLEDGRWGIIDMFGECVIPPFADYIGMISESKVPYKVGQKYGILDLSTKTKQMTDYDYISHFVEGVCIVGKFNQHNAMRFGYMKEDYTEIVPCAYIKACQFEDGQGYLETDDMTFRVDHSGRFIEIREKYDYTCYDQCDDFNWEEEVWYYLTGGQYGDYPDGNIDYDFIGL